MKSILPEWLYLKISNEFMLDHIFEIRIRLNKPIEVNYKGRYVSLVQKNGFTQSFLIANEELINYVMTVATKQSLYAFNHQIKQGFVTTENGIRIGICGTVVMNKNEVSTIKNITSLCIRIAHEVKECSEKIIGLICANGRVRNTLIISSPGAGKTTIIRDIVRKLSDEKNVKNILVVDERFEISANKENVLGRFVDVVSGCDKNFAFDSCLKTMNPSVIVTDEISKENDIEEIKTAIKSGVRVIATAHAENINDLKLKKYFKSILDYQYFERIVVLSKRLGVGTIEGVFDENLRGLYLPIELWKF